MGGDLGLEEECNQHLLFLRPELMKFEKKKINKSKRLFDCNATLF